MKSEQKKQTRRRVRSSDLDLGTLGHRIRSVRESARIEQPDFADSMGVSQNTQGKYERNDVVPDGGYLAKICRDYGVSAEWLLLGSGDQVAADRAPVPYDQGKMAFAMEVANSMAAAGRLPPGKSAAEWATEMYEFFVTRS